MIPLSEIESRFALQTEYLGNEKVVNKIRPLVSVHVITYQHFPYIVNCIEGILNQKVNFLYEIVVGEDGSNDGTREICKYYAENNPDIIRLFLRDRNLTVLFDNNGNYERSLNGTFTMMSARGKYVAICEGDDYWTDPYKLQNEQFGMVYSDVDRLNESTNIMEKNVFKNKLGIKKNTFEDFLINAWFLAPCTWLIRKNTLNNYQYLRGIYIVGDLPTLLVISKNYRIGYIDESMAVYRVLENSASHFKGLLKEFNFNQGIYKIQMDFVEHFNVSPSIVEQINTNYFLRIFNLVCLLNEKNLKKEAYVHLRQKNLINKKKIALYYITKVSILRAILNKVKNN